MGAGPIKPRGTYFQVNMQRLVLGEGCVYSSSDPHQFHAIRGFCYWPCDSGYCLAGYNGVPCAGAIELGTAIWTGSFKKVISSLGCELLEATWPLFQLCTFH